MSDETKTGAEMMNRVKDVIDYIRPLLQADGGDIELVGVDEDSGLVSVRLQGACRGCPGAAVTLKMGIERHLKEKVPEVTGVVAVDQARSKGRQPVANLPHARQHSAFCAHRLLCLHAHHDCSHKTR